MGNFICNGESSKYAKVPGSLVANTGRQYVCEPDMSRAVRDASFCQHVKSI